MRKSARNEGVKVSPANRERKPADGKRKGNKGKSPQKGQFWKWFTKWGVVPSLAAVIIGLALNIIGGLAVAYMLKQHSEVPQNLVPVNFIYNFWFNYNPTWIIRVGFFYFLVPPFLLALISELNNLKCACGAPLETI